MSFQESVGPVVCCVVTSEVERICEKHHGLCLASLLGAFAREGGSEGGALTFRSAAKHLALGGGLRVRFVNARDAGPPGPDAAAAADGAARAAAAPRDGERANLRACLDSAEAADALCAYRADGPWVPRWRRAVEDSLAFAGHEAFDCPAVLVVAVSAAEPAGVAARAESKEC